MRCPAPATERCADEQREVFANAAQKIGDAAPLSERYHTCRSQYAFMSFRSAVVFLTRKWTVKDKEKSQRVVSMESNQSAGPGENDEPSSLPGGVRGFQGSFTFLVGLPENSGTGDADTGQEGVASAPR